MITTLDWIAQQYHRADIDDLNIVEKQIVDRLIEEGYLVINPVEDPLINYIGPVCEKSSLYNELIYQP